MSQTPHTVNCFTKINKQNNHSNQARDDPEQAPIQVPKIQKQQKQPAQKISKQH